MKKLAIVGASAALAAMPLLGAFAVTDTIQLTVTKSCSMGYDGTTTSTGDTINLGSTTPGAELGPTTGTAGGDTDGTVMTVSCNTVEGWQLQATATALTSDADTIPFGEYPSSIVAGTTTSVWSASLAVSGADASSVTSLLNYTAIPGDSVVVNGYDSTNNHGISVNALTITPSYKAYVDVHQPVGSYSGTIEYTLVDLSL